MNLVEYLNFIIDLILLPEVSPPWWFKMGYTLVDTLIALSVLVTIKMLFEIFFYEIVFFLTRLWFRVFGKRTAVKVRSIIKQWKTYIYRPFNRNNLNLPKRNKVKGKNKIILTFQRWGYIGLFVAGLLPLPAFWGSIGPFLYNLERINKPWFKIFNYHFLWLWFGYMTKTAIVVIYFYSNLNK